MMPIPSLSRTRSLPSNWTRRVRSAIVHAASLANVAVAAARARARAEHHFDERVRLRAHVASQEREIGLLLEELRIKDARMERIDAQRRPHYPPAERLAILELRAARGW